MSGKYFAFGMLALCVSVCANVHATTVSIDVDSNVVATSSFIQDGYLFQSTGTFNVLTGSPDHIVANVSTSLGGLTIRRLDGEAFTLFAVVHSGPATIGGFALPATASFETTSLPIGLPGLDAVTSVSVALAPMPYSNSRRLPRKCSIPRSPLPSHCRQRHGYSLPRSAPPPSSDADPDIWSRISIESCARSETCSHLADYHKGVTSLHRSV